MRPTVFGMYVCVLVNYVGNGDEETNVGLYI